MSEVEKENERRRERMNAQIAKFQETGETFLDEIDRDLDFVEGVPPDKAESEI